MTDYGRKPKDESLRFDIRVIETDEVWYADIVSVGKAHSVAGYLVFKMDGTFWTAPRNTGAPVESAQKMLEALDMAEKVVRQYA